MHIVSVDIQDMAPIEGVHVIKGDITRKETVEQIIAALKGNKAELVVCDGAPDGSFSFPRIIVLGFPEIDQYIQSQILLSVLSSSSGRLWTLLSS